MKMYISTFQVIFLFMVISPCIAAAENQAFDEVVALSRTNEPADAAATEAARFGDRRTQSIKILIGVLDDPSKIKSVRIEAAKLLGLIRASEAVGVLIKYISLAPEVIREKTFQTACPCGFSLVSIGIPAIPLLVDELKKTNAKDGKQDTPWKQMILISCIRDIYNDGVQEEQRKQLKLNYYEYGIAMAKKRIELELAATKDESEKANLQAALEHQILKDEKVLPTK